MNLKTPTATLVLGSIGLLVVLLLSWFVVVSPATGKLTQAREDLTNVEDSNVTNELKLRALQAAEGDLPQTRESAQQLTAIFPDTADQADFFTAINAAAAAAGISEKQVKDVSPSSPTDPNAEDSSVATGAPLESDMAIQTVTLSVEASYSQISNLLDELTSMERALFVDTVSLAAGDKGVYTATISASTFVAPPLVDPGTDTEPAE